MAIWRNILLCLVSCTLLLALGGGCFPDLNLEGFPCTNNDDCLAAQCIQGVCQASTGPETTTNKDGGDTVDSTPIDTNTGPFSQSCYTGNDPSQQGTGNCRAGRKDMNTDTCVGEFVPAYETCGDGLDNDCDGYVDEACCKNPTDEVCDGKDNNCNGQIDESFPEKQKQCSPGGCSLGTYSCISGVLRCVYPLAKYRERCGTNEDENCDGTKNETSICGPEYSFQIVDKSTGRPPTFVMSTDGKRAKRGFATIPTGTPTNLIAERWMLDPNSAQKCQDSVLFLSPRSRQPLLTAYHCVDDKYMLLAATPQGTLSTDGGYQIIQPPTQDGTLEQEYGFVDMTTCPPQRKACRITRGTRINNTLERIKTGVFELRSPLCRQVPRPGLISIYSDKTPDAFGRIRSRGSTSCLITILDRNGKPVDRSFAFWLPDTKHSIWATFDANGSFLAGNPSHQDAAWTLKRTGSGNGAHFTLSHHSFSRATAAFINPLIPAITSTYIDQIVTTYDMHIHPFTTGTTTTNQVAAFTVLITH